MNTRILNIRTQLEKESRDAVEIVEQLQRNRFTAYFVGGCVRDILVGVQPKDFDIATNALPGQIKRRISFAYVIGRRFRLVLVKRGDKTFEVATFRRNQPPTAEVDDQSEATNETSGETTGESASETVSEAIGDNFFGSPEEDARRRDFTINALFYDPVKDDLIDYCNGIEDITNRCVRMIGEPNERLLEDPIRIMRALRLAHKIRFVLEPSLRAAMQANAKSLETTVLPRRREEILKWLRLDDPHLAFQEAYDLGLLEYIAPSLHQLYKDPEKASVFGLYLQRIKQISFDYENPGDLFGSLVLAYSQACLTSRDESQPPVIAFLESDDLGNFMRNELGMHNGEIGRLIRGFAMVPGLVDVGRYLRKGRKRKLAFLAGEHFDLGLHLASADYLISSQHHLFWINEKRQLLKN